MNIVLIGMRGSGKSTVGRKLAELLGKEFRELDSEVEAKVNMSIRDFVTLRGWDAFREEEAKAVREAAKAKNAVISTGGGVVVRDDNVQELKLHGICIYLRASADYLLKRIGGETSQLPRLTEHDSMAEEMRSVLFGREPLYEKAADEVVDTEKADADGVVQEILQRLKKRNIQ
jgi:shikimate kinase